MGYFLNGDAIAGRDERGQRITDKSFIIYFNASENTVDVTLPAKEITMTWEVVIDTSGENTTEPVKQKGEHFLLAPRSLIVLREYSEPEAEPDHSVAASIAPKTGVIPVISNPTNETATS